MPTPENPIPTPVSPPPPEFWSRGRTSGTVIRSRKPTLLSLLFLLAGLAFVFAYAVQAQGQEVTPTKEATGDTPPERPADLEASAKHDSVTLNWTASTDDTVTHYAVLRRDRNADASGAFHVIDSNAGPGLGYTDASVSPEGSYVYRVKAVSPTGVSQWSSYARADTPAASTPTPEPTPESTPEPTPEPKTDPEDLAPTGLTVALADAGGVTLSWSAPAEDGDAVTGYEILRAQGDEELATLVADTESMATTHTDATATEAGETYAYVVIALRGEEKSRQSNQAQVQAPHDPEDLAPSGLSVKVVSGDDAVIEGVALAWDAPAEDAASVTGYEVLRAVGDGEMATLVDDTGSAGTSHTDATATEAGESYAYRVKALRGEEASQPSDRAVAIIPQVTVQPSDPLIAARQSTGREIWSDTLTVGTYTTSSGTLFGWDDTGNYTGASLMDQDFDYGGDTYNLATITLSAGSLGIVFNHPGGVGDIATEATRDKLTLHVGTDTFNFGDGTLNSPQTGVTWDNAGLTWAAGNTVALSISVAVETTPVPTTWSLVPSGLGDGDSFRLLFISTSNRDATSSDIADYNTFIQNLVDTNGHTDIQAHSATFQMLGSTEDDDARDNTATRYTGDDTAVTNDDSGLGMPIYWLGGNKVADEYRDFYDGDWDNEATGASETGASVSIGTNWKIWTGSAQNGTEAMSSAGTSSRALGNAGGHWVMQGSPNGSDSAHGPIESDTANRTTDQGLYGLSGVFTVDSSLDPNTPPTFSLESTTREVAENSAGGTNVGLPVTAADADVDTLTYSLEGTDAASFQIVSTNGQIQTKSGVTYDYETKSSYSMTVRADDGNGGTATIVVAIDLLDVDETAPTLVPTTWSLVPSGLGDGDSFRLLFIGSTSRDASSSDIAVYNTFVQNLAAAGHIDIRAHSATFRVLGSTEAVDARNNTGTTGTGVPIYWLGGAKVADDYADFYDGSWDEEREIARETGASLSISGNWKIWTGSAQDGTEAMSSGTSRALGNAGGQWIMQGSPNGSDSAHGPIESDTANRTMGRGLYGLSGVFTVDASLDATSNPPMFTSGATFTAAERQTAVGTVEATDPDAGDTVTYAVTGGEDREHFQIDPASGELTFITSPDYESPADADEDNAYQVTVTATGGTGGRALRAEQDITVTVTNIIEPPGKPLGPWASWLVDNPGTLSVRWYAPHWGDESESFGKPPITSYQVRYQKGNIDDWGKWDKWEEWTYWPDALGIPTVEAAGNSARTEFSVNIDGLEPGATYQLQVRAISDDGAGVWSNRGSNRKPTGPVAEVDVNGDGIVDADPVITLPVGGAATYWVRPGRCEGYKSLNAQALRGTTENAPQHIPLGVSPTAVHMTCAGEDDPGEWREITLTGPSDELLSTSFEASVRHTVMYRRQSHESWIFLMSWGHLVRAVVPAPETLEPVGSLTVTPEEGRDRPHLTWNAVPGAPYYQVQWRWGPDEEWGPFHSQGGAIYTRQKVTEETAYTIPISETVPTVNDVKRTQDVMVRVRPYDYDRLAVGPWREVTLPGRAVRPPEITGTAQVGETLTADTSPITRESAALADAAFSYQWLRTGGVYGYYDIPGATDSTYTLTPHDEVRRIKVRVTFTNEEGEEETQTSSVTAKVAPADADE